MLVANKEENLNHKRLGHIGDSKEKILEKDHNIKMSNENCISCDCKNKHGKDSKKDKSVKQ